MKKLLLLAVVAFAGYKVFGKKEEVKPLPQIDTNLTDNTNAVVSDGTNTTPIPNPKLNDLVTTIEEDGSIKLPRITPPVSTTKGMAGIDIIS